MPRSLGLLAGPSLSVPGSATGGSIPSGGSPRVRAASALPAGLPSPTFPSLHSTADFSGATASFGCGFTLAFRSTTLAVVPLVGGFAGASPPATRLHNPTPVPTVPGRNFNNAPKPAQRNALPSRDSFNLPAIEEIQLLEAVENNSSYGDPAALRASAGWLNEAEDSVQRNANGGLGTIGIVAAGLILMALVFIGAKLLMN